jgi:protoheme IX farnesyltransferase
MVPARRVAAISRAGSKRRASSRLSEFFALTKPKVVALVVFTAVIGMFLATPGMVALSPLVFGAIGIALVAGAAAATNCLLEAKIDARMARTRARPLVAGKLQPVEAGLFAFVIGGAGLGMLYVLVNPLTMWLTLATFAGYAIVYTLLLKPRTPQNIVIGGAAGAMPPVLGWAAVTGEVSVDALLLFLIIFLWTPPHFWSLALYRRDDYAKAGVPMLPVTHGIRYTTQQALLYTVALLAVSLLPCWLGMSGVVYLASALSLGAVFIGHSVELHRSYSDQLAREMFRYSIVYLAALFAALLVDHYL